LLGIASKENIKSEVKDYDAEVMNLGLLVSKNLVKFYDEGRVQANIKESQTNLRFIQEEDKHINTVIEKNMSMEHRIIRDNADPFT
jgi:hypothetical protein